MFIVIFFGRAYQLGKFLQKQLKSQIKILEIKTKINDYRTLILHERLADSPEKQSKRIMDGSYSMLILITASTNKLPVLYQPSFQTASTPCCVSISSSLNLRNNQSNLGK